MQAISKPRIVDFLRTCDKHHWVYPRIRFASVRSKPELIEDIHEHFAVSREGNFISIKPRLFARRIPAIQYDLEVRKFLLDGDYRELQKESREKPSFSIVRENVTIQFGDFHMCGTPNTTGTVAAALLPFLTRGIGGPQVDAS